MGQNGLRLQTHSENGHVLIQMLPALRLQNRGSQNLSSTRALERQTRRRKEGSHVGPLSAGVL